MELYIVYVLYGWLCGKVYSIKNLPAHDAGLNNDDGRQAGAFHCLAIDSSIMIMMLIWKIIAHARIPTNNFDVKPFPCILCNWELDELKFQGVGKGCGRCSNDKIVGLGLVQIPPYVRFERYRICAILYHLEQAALIQFFLAHRMPPQWLRYLLRDGTFMYTNLGNVTVPVVHSKAIINNLALHNFNI